ncbi:hypothetical protein IAD21_01186 [Abditibacteriota bacterium]|nr:hypothetical protein IAD21_01186 [Abditibacteriota bacterium]
MNIPLSRVRPRFDALRATRTLLVALCAFATMRGANAATFTNYANAKLVIGQADFTTVSNTPTQTTTPGANDSALSSLGVLAVSQQGGRVFLYNTIPTTNGAPADVIVGKPDFTSYAQGTGDPSNPTPAANLLRNSSGVAFSPDGKKLLVSDFTNNRVLIWNTIPTTNGAAADVVIGQTDFESNSFGCSAIKLSEPVAVMVTPGGKVLISDYGNRRVVVYNSIPTTNGAAADYVIGQTNLTSYASSTAANGLTGPWHTALSPGGKLLIADATSNSVRIFNTFPTASNASADVIIGQTAFGYPTPDPFVSPVPTPSDSTLNQPIGVSVSPTGQVAIGEFRNNRTLIYNSIPTSNGAAADVVLGQPDFATRDYHDSTNGGATSQKGLSRTYGVTFIPDGRLLVSDIDNSRELVFGDTTPTITAATIAPLAPKTNNLLTVTPTASDADGDTLTYTYQWYKNNNILSGETNQTLDLSKPGNGDKGDAITCVVTASDSSGNSSTPRTSDEVIVQNSAPVVTSAVINHKHPLTYYTLTAGAKTSDADSDLLTLTYQWNKNGQPISGETNPTLDLNASGNGDDGDNISVTITAHDNNTPIADSAPVTSDSVPIGNIAPKILYLRPLNASNKVGDKRLFSMQVKDENEVGDIVDMVLLINTEFSANNGAYIVYDPHSGFLYMRQGNSYLPPIHIGAQAGPDDILDNGALRIVGSEVTTAVTSGNTVLTIAIPATVRNGLVGVNSFYGRVADAKGTNDPAATVSGFVNFGPYTVTPQFAGKSNTLPTLSKLTPGASFTTLNAMGIAPTPQNFGFFAADEDGAGDIESMWFLAGPVRDWAHSATFVFYPRDRRLFLRSDDGQSFLGGGRIGTTGIIENSQVKVDLSKVKLLIYNDGKSLGLSLPLQAKTGLAGQNKVWLRVQDTKGAVAAGSDSLGFVLSGNWDIKKQEGADAPGAAPSSPSS